MSEEGYDSTARSMAQDAMEVAREALSEARDASASADRAQEMAHQALREIAALERRVEELEEIVRELIRMLERKLDELIRETEEVRGAVETQGQQIREGVDKTTESVAQGFTAMSHQEVRGRLLDSRTALLGLATKLSAAKLALYGEFEQARKRTDELKVRYTEAFERTKGSLKRDIDRLGAQIIRVQAEDFRKTIEEHLPSARRQEGVFQIARRVGTASLEERNTAMQVHIDRATEEGLEQFDSARKAFLAQVSAVLHRRLKADPGDYAMRVYFADGRGGQESVSAAQIEPHQNRVVFRAVDKGMGRIGEHIKGVWGQAGPPRGLTQEERARVDQYVRQLQSQGLLTPEESGIILHHLDRTPLTILVPSVEAAHGSRA